MDELTKDINDRAGAPSALNVGLGKLDPRCGDGKIISGRLWDIYQKAFDDFAGPRQFRHSSNYDIYHRAGLLAVYQYLTTTPNGQIMAGA